MIYKDKARRRKGRPNRNTLRVWGRIVFGVIVFAAIVFCFIWQTIQYNSLREKREELQTAMEQMRNENTALIAEVARLSSPERVMEIARDEMNMEPIRPEQIVTLNLNDHISTPASTNSRMPDR